jgi:hypothetical protein
MPGQRVVGQQFQPDQGGPERHDPDLGHTEVVRNRRGVGEEVLGRLARKDLDVQPLRGPGIYRDHLRNVHDLTAGDAVAGVGQPEPGDDILHTLGELLIPNGLPSFRVSTVTPLLWMP